MTKDAPVFIIGAARCGSTALAESVALSFGLDLVSGKESHFLAANGLPERSGGPNGQVFDRMRARTLSEFYARVPGGPGKFRFLDASTSSLFYSTSAVNTLDSNFPNARLIAILRNPVHRAESAHRFMVGRGLEELSLADAIVEEPRRVEKGWSYIYRYVGTGRYAEQIEALGKWRDRTLFLLYERDLHSDTLMDRISDHIGYPIVCRPPLATRNEARSFSAPALSRVYDTIRSTKAVRATPPGVRRRIRTLVDQFRTPLETDVDLAVRAKLLDEFWNDSARLGDMTGLDVSLWFE